MHGFGSGRCRQPGNHSTDGRKIEMPAFYRRHEAALAPQWEQGWVENLSLTTERHRRARPQLSAAVSAATTSKIIPPIMNELLMLRAALADSVHELSKGGYCAADTAAES